MLDVNDFVTDRGGNPNKIKESQRKRFAPEGVVDEVYTLYEEARRGILPIHGGMTRNKLILSCSTVWGDENRLWAECHAQRNWKKEEGQFFQFAFCNQDNTNELWQNKEDANDLIEQKTNLEKSKKDAEELAAQKETQRDRKVRTIGNYVHESVPVSNNEVGCLFLSFPPPLICDLITKVW